MLDQIKLQLESESNPILGLEHMKKFAVVIPLIKQANGSLAILFEKRSMRLRRQPGEISFPGGKVEETDLNIVYAAVRETCEELGIEDDNIEVIKQLGAFVPSRHSIIYPIVAYIKTRNFDPNPQEVEEIFCVPIDFFLENEPDSYHVKLKAEPEEDFPFHLIPKGKEYPWGNYLNEYFYQFEGYVIWGMTAHILYNFILMIKKDAR